MSEKLKAADIIAIMAKGGLGAIPVLGPLSAEIIGGIIPNQRIDRLEDTVKRLEEMLDADGVRLFKSKMDDPEFIDLFEEAMLQAARALTKERRENIAKLLKNGMTDEEQGHQTKRRLLETFERVNDTEVIILMAHSYDRHESTEFWETHEDILAPPEETIGVPLAPRSAETVAMTKAYMHNLVGLGLIREGKTGVAGIAGLAPGNAQLTRFGWLMVKYLSDQVLVDAD